MFWKKIKSEEYKILLERIQNLERKLNFIEIDLSFLTEKLEKAVKKRIVKPEKQKDNSKNPVLLPE
ncbi:hypothetical protein ES703_61320 [subsurface metagenome]